MDENKKANNQTNMIDTHHMKSRDYLARDDVDVMIIQRCTCKHGAMGMESGASNWGAFMMKEAGVRLEAGKVCSINVVGLDLVTVGAPRIRMLVGHVAIYPGVTKSS